MIQYEKTFQIWILKNLVRNFSYFQAIFMNPWSRGKHSWLWIRRSGFESWSEHLFFSFFSHFCHFEKLWKTLRQCQFQNGVCHFRKYSRRLVRKKIIKLIWEKKIGIDPDLNRGPLKPKLDALPLLHLASTESLLKIKHGVIPGGGYDNRVLGLIAWKLWQAW